LPRDAGGDIGLDLMVSGNDGDGLTQHLATEIFGGHLRSGDRSGTGRRRRRPGQIGQDADLDDIVGHLRAGCAGGNHKQGRKPSKPMHESPPVEVRLA
jgi:hypothetical protein